jgi:hypothetical protein
VTPFPKDLAAFDGHSESGVEVDLLVAVHVLGMPCGALDLGRMRWWSVDPLACEEDVLPAMAKAFPDGRFVKRLGDSRERLGLSPRWARHACAAALLTVKEACRE